MAGSRTLKLSILGDVDNLNKSLKTASGDVDTFGDKVGKAGVAIGKAFAAAAAAAGAAAIAIGIEGVKAAIADEKAQTQLALALENSTGATKAQIAATEQSILQMSLATGVADDELRPALGRLVRSTGDITKAQDLLAIALDISAATGKPVEAISNSLSKAYDGNTAALGKLGVGLSTAELKTMSFEQVQGRLTELFGGAAAANADTYAGKIARVQVAFDEAKETIGVALLPILDKLLQFINDNALPAINAFSNAFSLTQGDGLGKVMTDVANTIKKTVQPIFEGAKSVFDNVKNAIMNSKDEFAAFWEVVKFIAPLIGQVIGAQLRAVGQIAEVVITVIAKVLAAIKPLLNTAIDGINLVIRGLNIINPLSDIPYLPKIGATSGSTSTGALGNFSMSTGTTMTTPTVTTGGAVTTGVTTGVTSGGGATGLTSGGGSVATVARKATEAITNIAGAFDNFTSGTTTLAGIESASTRGFPFGTSGVNTNTLAGILAASQQPSVVVNFNGVTTDPEGTARVLVDTLNNSFYRGTGGANNLQIA
jgi:phage-related protein